MFGRSEVRVPVRAATFALLVVALLARAAWAEEARPTTREERKRRELLERLGLDKADSPPAPAPSTESEPPAAVGPAPAAADPRASGVATPPSVGFKGAVHAGLIRSCQACHRAGGPAAGTRFLLDGDAARDHARSRALVNVADAPRSTLVTKAAGVVHGGGAPFPKGSPAQRLLLRWITAGALLEPRRGAEGVATAPSPAPVRPQAPKRPVPPAVPPPGPGTPPAPELSVPAPPVAPPVVIDPAIAAAAPPAAAVTAYDPELHTLLTARCSACHAAGGMASASRYLLGGAVDADYRSARALIDLVRPEDSVLLTKAVGKAHAGGAIFPGGGAERALLLAWIKGGAILRAPSPPAPPSLVADGSAAKDPPPPPAPAPGAPPAALAAPVPPAPPADPHRGLELPLSLRLNGRFDLNYERRNVADNPFSGAAANALQNYHRFLFLTRDASPNDPLGFTAEIMGLEFWEAHLRVGPRAPGARWRAWLKLGKLLVPFGAEPLFHQRYGGHVGFDQRVVPIIWAQPGARAQVLLSLPRLSVTFDLYAVNGFALRNEDAILNLQNDVSALDDARIAVGQRLGLAAGPVAVWYSAYYSPLGFGRHLFLQAVDLGIARWRGVPVVNRFTAAVGLLRGDVSGGGSGHDYYHFASYAQLRFYPWDWLYLQYRQGLRTFNNRRGVYQDDTRWTVDDGSTHNFEVVGRYHGATLGLGYFINLEKANEVANDLLRLTVALEF